MRTHTSIPVPTWRRVRALAAAAVTLLVVLHPGSPAQGQPIEDQLPTAAPAALDHPGPMCAVSADAAERRGARHPGDVCTV